jgi:hypothetical protein
MPVAARQFLAVFVCYEAALWPAPVLLHLLAVAPAPSVRRHFGLPAAGMIGLWAGIIRPARPAWPAPG